MKSRSSPVDLVALAKQFIDDYAEFQNEGVKNEIAMMYLYSAYQAGKDHGWWQHQEQNYKDTSPELEDPFDEAFFGSDKYNK